MTDTTTAPYKLLTKKNFEDGLAAGLKPSSQAKRLADAHAVFKRMDDGGYRKEDSIRAAYDIAFAGLKDLSLHQKALIAAGLDPVPTAPVTEPTVTAVVPVVAVDAAPTDIPVPAPTTTDTAVAPATTPAPTTDAPADDTEPAKDESLWGHFLRSSKLAVPIAFIAKRKAKKEAKAESKGVVYKNVQPRFNAFVSRFGFWLVGGLIGLCLGSVFVNSANKTITNMLNTPPDDSFGVLFKWVLVICGILIGNWIAGKVNQRRKRKLAEKHAAEAAGPITGIPPVPAPTPTA